jgi:trimeric autotransporter adhesin
MNPFKLNESAEARARKLNQLVEMVSSSGDAFEHGRSAALAAQNAEAALASARALLLEAQRARDEALASRIAANDNAERARLSEIAAGSDRILAEFARSIAEDSRQVVNLAVGAAEDARNLALARAIAAGVSERNAFASVTAGEAQASIARTHADQARISATSATSAVNIAQVRANESEAAALASAVSSSSAAVEATAAGVSAAAARQSELNATAANATTLANASAAAASAVAADSARAAALSSSTLTAEFRDQAKGFATTVGLTPNPHFTEGTLFWNNNTAVLDNVSPISNNNYAAQFQGRSDVLFGVLGLNFQPVGQSFAVDGTRRYNLNSEIYSSAAGVTNYIGLSLFSSSGQHLGYKYGTTGLRVSSAQGWALQSTSIGGIGAGGDQFTAGTVRAQPIALLNYFETGGNNGLQAAINYFIVEDGTQAELARTQAQISQTAATEATAAAASATATAQTLATLTGAGGAASTIALHTSQIQALVTENAAQATELTNLSASLTGVNNTLASQSSQLTNIVNVNSAQTTAINNTNASLTGVNNTLATQSTQLANLATENAAQATSISNVTASLTGTQSVVAGHTSQITALANENAAQATALTSLSSASGTQSALVSVLQATTADSAAKLASARLRLVTSASGGTPALFELFSENAPGGLQSFIRLAASQILFGDNTVFNDATDILETTIAGGVVNAVAWGAPFGIAGDSLLEWVGPANIAVGNRSKANAHFYKSAVAPFIGGNALTSMAASSPPVPIGLGISASVIRTVPPGGSISVFAALVFGPISGTTTVTINLEAGVGGANFGNIPGTFTADSGSTGDTLLPESAGIYSNTSGLTQVVHIRANTVRTGSATGPVDAGRSYLQV